MPLSSSHSSVMKSLAALKKENYTKRKLMISGEIPGGYHGDLSEMSVRVFRLSLDSLTCLARSFEPRAAIAWSSIENTASSHISHISWTAKYIFKIMLRLSHQFEKIVNWRKVKLFLLMSRSLNVNLILFALTWSLFALLIHHIASK